MKQSYWHTNVQETDADEIEGHLQRTTFASGATRFELIEGSEHLFHTTETHWERTTFTRKTELNEHIL